MKAFDEQLHRFVENTVSSMELELEVSLAIQSAEQTVLSSGELERLAEFKLERRKQSWSLGRAALKSLCNTLGYDTDTSLLKLPHPRLSLTHSESVAMAIGCREETGGIGIDLELVKQPDQESARFFLTGFEMHQLKSVPHQARPWLLQKLWCIKEAAFKANPDNHSTHVFDYEVQDIFSDHGVVVWLEHAELHGRYNSTPLISEYGQGCVAFVSYCKGENNA